MQSVSGHRGSVTSEVLADDDSQGVTASRNTAAKLYEHLHWQLRADIIETYGLGDSGRCLSASESSVMTASGDKTAKNWSTRTGDCGQTLSKHKG